VRENRTPGSVRGAAGRPAVPTSMAKGVLMTTDNLRQFDLHFPGTWIEDTDRNWALENNLVLKSVQNLFVEAVAAYSLFRPITADNSRESIHKDQSPYQRCLNGLYAKAFVFALDGIGKLLSRLCKHLRPPAAIRPLCEDYEREFGHLKHIRDSAIHIEDRGRGRTRHQQPVNANVLILGCFIERRFAFTGEDGKQYEVEISDTTLLKAKEIIQELIDTYPWIPSVSGTSVEMA